MHCNYKHFLNNKLTYLAIALFFVSNTFAAKDCGDIYGKIVEKGNGNVLSFATISVQNNANKILGGAISGEDGKFSVSNIIFGECIIKVSFIGYKDTTFSVHINNESANIDLGAIALSSDAVTLTSAVVTARVPVIEQKLDKIVMNVADAVSTQGNNALEVLRKAPGISIDPSGNILLNGSGAQVWIDGRPSYLSGEELEALLSGTDASTIDKIEIIAHPSAKYDASGSGGIINIRTKRNFAKGLSGSVRAGYAAAPYSQYYQGSDGTLNVSYRGEKTNTSVTYSPRYDEHFSQFTSTTDLGNGLIVKGMTKNDAIQKSHSYKIANDFFLNKKNIVGIIISGLDKSSKENTYDPVTGNHIYLNNILKEEVKTGIDNTDNFGTISANLNYSHIFRENKELTVNADYGYYDMGKYSFQTNEYLDNAGNTSRAKDMLKSNSDQYINIKSVKLDYEQMLWNAGKLETGLKWAESRTDNDLIREDMIAGQWVRNGQLSSKFKYTEDVSAAYASISRQINSKWSAKAGLRAELTNANGDWISSDTVTTKHYLNIFPTAFVGYTPNEKLRLGLSYTYRIQRPKFDQLNPFREYIDASSSMEGNPDLDPEFSHEMSLSLGIGQHLSLSLNGQFTKNAIIQNANFNETTGEKMLLWDNFGNQSFLGGAVSITELPVTKWFSITANIFMANLSNQDAGYKKNSLFSQGYLNSAFILPNDYRIELSGWFQSGLPYGYFEVDPTGDLSIAAKKNLLGNKATISLNISDLLGTMRSRAKLNIGKLNDYNFESKWKSQQAIISFSYRFGQAKASRQRKVGEYEESKRVSSGN